MTTDDKNEKKVEGNDDRLLSQYHEAYENLRLEDKYIWQIPSFITAVVGTLVVIIFTAMDGTAIWAREAILGIALLFTVIMGSIQRRYEHFESIAVGTLSEIEKQMGTKHIQRTASPHTREKLYTNGVYYKSNPGWRSGSPGHMTLFWTMVITGIIILVLMIFLIINNDKILNNTTIEPIPCIEKTLSYVMIILSFISTVVIVIVSRCVEIKKIKANAKLGK